MDRSEDSPRFERLDRCYPAIRATVTSLAVVTVLALLAIDGQSLWIDELGTWRLTLADSWQSWLTQLLYWPNSDAQIPLYHLYMKAWVTVFPTSEYSLRASNLPWIFVGVFALVTTPLPTSARRIPRVMAAVLCMHPMLWYYANEARPYAMLFAGFSTLGSSLLVRVVGDGSLNALAASNTRAIIGFTIMAATSAIGLIWSISFLLPLSVLAYRQGKDSLVWSRATVVVGTICFFVLLPVACQYLATFLRGITATTLHEHKVQNFAFGIYEILGFGGVGPGREELRSAAMQALSAYRFELAAFALVTLIPLFHGIAGLYKTDRDTFVLLTGSAIVPLAILFVLGYVKHWRVVGRHMMPLLFFYAYYVVQAVEAALANSNRSRRRLALTTLAVAMLTLFVSSVAISFADRHKRENYRNAASVATNALHQKLQVWWVADSLGAAYYGVPLSPLSTCNANAGTRANEMANVLTGELLTCPKPAFVIIGRPDTFDRDGAVARYVTESNYRHEAHVHGFEIWQASAND